MSLPKMRKFCKLCILGRKKPAFLGGSLLLFLRAVGDGLVFDLYLLRPAQRITAPCLIFGCADIPCFRAFRKYHNVTGVFLIYIGRLWVAVRVLVGKGLVPCVYGIAHLVLVLIGIVEEQ